ncbi:hypothetical protein JXM67_05715 [candidate division WOR-3 bacterium]|nr:hypothetical protein [candidate division WOR-3 bacterium]
MKPVTHRSLTPLTTHEVGSMAKPSWRVKPFRNLALTDADIEKAEAWGRRLEIEETAELLELLSKRRDFSKEEKDRIRRFSSLYGIRLQEKAGLDLVWDGEQQRVEMYEHPVKRMSGFRFRGHVRSFDNKYYRKASCVGEPGLKEDLHTEEYKMMAGIARNPLKVPVTGAYTIVDWSFDENYVKDLTPGAADIHERRRKARSQFLVDVSQETIYPTLKSLHEAGAKYLQIDEPAATTKRDEIPEFIGSVAESIGDLAGKAFFTIHICFSDYMLLFPHLKELEGILDEVHLEYANRDSQELGTTADKRFGYEILHDLKNTSFVVGLGVLHIHTDFIEPPELVRDRILYAVDVIGDPARIMVSPDCGLRTRTWEVTYEKLRNMIEGVQLARKVLGIS